ncbi:unnamed protein product [Auanema sp. JU1783]|nr:unnamed protein product [Auanema sp. JU1783]
MRLIVLTLLVVLIQAVSAETVRSHLPRRSFRSSLRVRHAIPPSFSSQNTVIHRRQRIRPSLLQRVPVVPSTHLLKPNRKRTRGPVPPAIPTRKPHFLRPSKRVGPPAMKPPRGIVDKLNKASSNDFRRLAAFLLRRHKQ